MNHHTEQEQLEIHNREEGRLGWDGKRKELGLVTSEMLRISQVTTALHPQARPEGVGGSSIKCDYMSLCPYADCQGSFFS